MLMETAQRAQVPACANTRKVKSTARQLMEHCGSLLLLRASHLRSRYNLHAARLCSLAFAIESYCSGTNTTWNLFAQHQVRTGEKYAGYFGCTLDGAGLFSCHRFHMIHGDRSLAQNIVSAELPSNMNNVNIWERLQIFALHWMTVVSYGLWVCCNAVECKHHTVHTVYSGIPHWTRIAVFKNLLLRARCANAGTNYLLWSLFSPYIASVHCDCYSKIKSLDLASIDTNWQTISTSPQSTTI